MRVLKAGRGAKNVRRSIRTPEYFATAVRSVESAGGNCVRLYFATERRGAWEDQFTLVIPIEAAITASGFVVSAASGIFDEINNVTAEPRSKQPHNH
jgi:hypothetical protein